MQYWIEARQQIVRRSNLVIANARAVYGTWSQVYRLHALVDEYTLQAVLLDLAFRRVESSAVHILDPLAKHDAADVIRILQTLASSARYHLAVDVDVRVNTASLTSANRTDHPQEPQVFGNAGLPSENVLPQDFPSIPMLTGQTGLGTLEFLNDLSTSSLQAADWFNFFEF